MDIGPPSQKHCTKSKDADAGEPHAKRQKLCDESSSEKDVISEKTTPSAPDEPAEKSDTNAKVNVTTLFKHVNRIDIHGFAFFLCFFLLDNRRQCCK